MLDVKDRILSRLLIVFIILTAILKTIGTRTLRPCAIHAIIGLLQRKEAVGKSDEWAMGSGDRRMLILGLLLIGFFIILWPIQNIWSESEYGKMNKNHS